MLKENMVNLDKKQEIGQRLRSEFNDLKRTIPSISKDMNYPEEKIKQFINGDYDTESFIKFLIDFGNTYPVDISDLLLTNSDTENGILFFSLEKSKKSSRVFSRKNRNEEFTPYYEYRDTAKSNLCYFYPEWIEQLRFVEDNDPCNPDVVYNEGHLLHQYGLFVGPVNYYYELKGKKYCVEMNTGDSSYISPYIKHSFASRSKNEIAYIIAVTNGGLVKRNHKEFINFGKEFLNNSVLPIESKKDTIFTIIRTALSNELLSEEDVDRELNQIGNKKLKDFYDFNEIDINDLINLSKIIKIDPGDLLIQEHETKDGVINKFYNEKDSRIYPDKNNPTYKIFRTVITNKVYNLKGFLLNSLVKSSSFDFAISFSLNLYMINFGKSDVTINWMYKDKQHSKIIRPFDSLYLEPHIKFYITSESKDNHLFIVTTGTSITMDTKKELSFFKEPLRTITDKDQWFNGKKDE